LRLKLGRKKLMEMAAKLGSDVPFFLNRTAGIVHHRGENVKKIGKIF